jgi:23S rRNA (pseudouridine1915-N3)-methyltransferase
MIRIIAGGKKNAGWAAEACAEYEKRLRKPYDLHWEFYDEEKLARKLTDWPFEKGREYVICCDVRGKNISSPEYAHILERAFGAGKDIVILVGGAYGFAPEVRSKADFVWSFSKLVYPHGIARVVCIEQIYRASQILSGGPYHHE